MDDPNREEILEVVRDLDKHTRESTNELRSDMRLTTEALNRLSGSLEANWELTRKQGDAIVRLSTLNEERSKERAEKAHEDMERAFYGKTGKDLDNDAVMIPRSMIKVFGLGASALLGLVTLIGVIIGIPL